MSMNLVMVSQSGIEKAASDSGLSLTADQVRDIAEAESTCLAECGRVSFGESAAVRVIRELGSSPFIAGDDTTRTLMELTEAFYDLREDFPASITDAEILELLGESFNGDAAGDVGLVVALASETLSRQRDQTAYEITDGDGNVYRWDPEEWCDDITANGWCGERWEDADE